MIWEFAGKQSEQKECKIEANPFDVHFDRRD
jgi:hypothetical protein